MGEILALSAAVGFGINHFLAGVLSRRAAAVAVAVFAQIGGTLLITVAAVLFPYERLTTLALGWGALSGIGTGVGVAFLFRGLAKGQMSVVSPLSEAGAVALSILVGVVVLGENPSLVAMGGIGLALPAIWLISRRAEPGPGAGAGGSSRRATGAVDGLSSGAGLALHFVALSQITAEAGLWPLVVSRAVSVVAIAALAAAPAPHRGCPLALPPRQRPWERSAPPQPCFTCSPHARRCSASRWCSPRSTRRSRSCSPASS